MSESAARYIDSFQRGEQFSPPAKGLIVNGQVDTAALQILGNGLATEGGEVREKIIELLVSVGQQVDPLTARGTIVLRHPQIIELLVYPGMIKADLGRNAAMDALRKLVLASDLQRYGAIFTKALDDFPSEDAFLLVAKAKPQPAKVVVDKLMLLPTWKNLEAARIARAALGDVAVENEFLAAVDAAHEPEALAHALGSIALIGTPRSLKVLAEQLRTPLIIDKPGAFKKSVRLDVLEGLLYNFPDQPVLYPNNINNDQDYAAAESFCSNTLGAVYNSPRPAFMKYGVVPFPMPQ